MRKLYLFAFLIILLSSTFLLLSSNVLGVDNINSIMNQGSTKTCLQGKLTGPLKGNGKQMTGYGTLNLTGQCISNESGCEIWRYNSANTNIEVNEKMLKYCKNGEKSGNRNYCDRTDEIEEEIEYDVDIKPGWVRITDFIILSSRLGETNIALGEDNNKVLGVEAGKVPAGNVNIQVSGKYAAHVEWSYYAIGDGLALPTEMGSGRNTVEEQNPLAIGISPISGQLLTLLRRTKRMLLFIGIHTAGCLIPNL
jgi:hypothetical protein